MLFFSQNLCDLMESGVWALGIAYTWIVKRLRSRFPRFPRYDVDAVLFFIRRLIALLLIGALVIAVAFIGVGALNFLFATMGGL